MSSALRMAAIIEAIDLPVMSAPTVDGLFYRMGRISGRALVADPRFDEDVVLIANAAELEGFVGGVLDEVWKSIPNVRLACFWVKQTELDLFDPKSMAHVYQSYYDPLIEHRARVLFVTSQLDGPVELEAVLRSFKEGVILSEIAVLSEHIPRKKVEQ